MSRLLLINGAPGSGKSSVAAALAQRHPGMLALDIDVLKHSLSDWEQNPGRAGLRARRIALRTAGEHMAGGHDVVMGQYLAGTRFIHALEDLASRHDARFVEVVLTMEASALATRLRHRRLRPTRAEQWVNDRLVQPEDADRLTRSIEALVAQRPAAVRVDASGSLEDTVAVVDSLMRDG